MNARTWSRLQAATREATPVLLTILVLLLGSIPLHLPYLQPIGPALVLVAVYYWSAHTPALMRPQLVFVIGLMSDFLGGAPIGVGVLVLLAAQAMAFLQRRLFEDATGFAIWLWFVTAAALTGLLGWAITSQLAGTLMDPWPVGLGTLLAALVYPFVAWIFGPIQRSLLREA